MATAHSQAGQVTPHEARGSRSIRSAVNKQGQGNGDLEGVEDAPTIEASSPLAPVYSVFTTRQKYVIVMAVSFVAMLSPLSGAIYYPATPALAAEYNVSMTEIVISITTYQIVQGIAPSFIGNYSDIYGRKPAYAICLVLYLAANIGLALQNSYAALMVLRCLQSAGSSATVALATGAVADLVTRAERGKFMAYSAIGLTLGPALGPVIGGLLTQYLGWRSIFWFLSIFSVAILAVYFVFVPETARNVVGNGSVPPPRLFMTPFQHAERRRRSPVPSESEDADQVAAKASRKQLNPFAALKILGERDGGITLGFGSLVYGGFFMVLTTLPVEFEERFGFNAAQTGLCYLPIFIGTVVSPWVSGKLLDWNFHRHARRLGIVIDKRRQQDVDNFPIEAARLEICIPMIYLTALFVIAYGWTVQARAPLALIEVVMFFVGVSNSGGVSGLSTLVVDTHQDSPATAQAANNLFRCLVSAGATAVAVPLVDRIGMGWTSVFIGGVWIAFSPCLWLVMIYGARWRRDKRAKMKEVEENEGDTREKDIEEGRPPKGVIQS
ncbi:related to dityrosine transporter [Cephalotrichum gorgonifer]|uniref:Related to dityrosine transporter n=1 Tax=Cephalotrichum gorgonifer TaxID=2041049 RepID=A0AAE8N2F9_9PEZI|nr:related to dityrosine transporter [Cephalotrichum gorgonifer]